MTVLIGNALSPHLSTDSKTLSESEVYTNLTKDSILQQEADA